MTSNVIYSESLVCTDGRRTHTHACMEIKSSDVNAVDCLDIITLIYNKVAAPWET
jgi:hypothetical protein